MQSKLAGDLDTCFVQFVTFVQEAHRYDKANSKLQRQQKKAESQTRTGVKLKQRRS